ncbi:hypothetical protein M0R88_09935 [Halorussus gelatinilyticus]|uniref:Uncharacterized protein n=1 Tax=Halorussus gelatinilyticus TaxID=2937524 RepID=A0A8U0IF73_9EURY|nr:hypothetical protein [Halorussus gelatinilyticus]UPV98851.1 hypothetical protein M0R88_09935 [Halorussus gelatinilyticus]
MNDALLALAANEGIFGVPHDVLSSRDEWLALGIGLIAVAFAVLYDGDFDLRPLRTAAVVGIVVSLGLSALAPPIVTDEWHIPRVVLVLALGAAYAYRRRDR